MKCPNCEKKAITFIKWAQGTRWYKTKCISCGTDLSANDTTIIAGILSVLFGVTGAIIGEEYFNFEIN